MYKKILLAVDGSPASHEVIREASRLATIDTLIRVITIADNPAFVFDAPYGIHYDLGAVRQAVLQQAKATLERAHSELEQLEVKAETSLVDLTTQAHGTVVKAILDEAKAWEAELIVLGTHGRRGVKRLLLGSVAEMVVRTSPVPVLLVRSSEPFPFGLFNPAEIYRDWPEDEVIGG